MEAANLLTFLKFGNAKKSDFVLSLPKIVSGHEQNCRGLCPPSPGLKPLLLLTSNVSKAHVTATASVLPCIESVYNVQ